jgi:secretion system chaperone SscA
MEQLNAYFSEGGTLRKLYALEPEALDKMYGYACQRYRAADYEGARQLYFALATIDANNFDYWLATGLCFQRQQRHDEALFCFARSAALRLVDPRPPYLAGISFQLSGDEARAGQAFESAVKCCGKQEAHAGLRRKAEAARQSLGRQE